MSFRIKIVTPSALAFEGSASEVVVPGFEGQYGILPSHAQILTLSKPGVLSIFSEKGEASNYIIGKGFVEFSNNAFTALVDVFEAIESIDKDVSSGRLKELNIERDQLSPTDAKYIQLTNEIELEQARLDA